MIHEVVWSSLWVCVTPVTMDTLDRNNNYEVRRWRYPTTAGYVSIEESNKESHGYCISKCPYVGTMLHHNKSSEPTEGAV